MPTYTFNEDGEALVYFLTVILCLLSFFGTILGLLRRKDAADIFQFCSCKYCKTKGGSRKAKDLLRMAVFLGWTATAFFACISWNIRHNVNPNSKDPHVILGIPYDATEDQIGKRYRELSKIYHPDRNKDKDATIFTELTRAYRILTDKGSQKEYERTGWFQGQLDQKPGVALPSWLAGGGGPYVMLVYAFLISFAIPLLFRKYGTGHKNAKGIFYSTMEEYYRRLNSHQNISDIIDCLCDSKEFSTGGNGRINCKDIVEKLNIKLAAYPSSLGIKRQEKDTDASFVTKTLLISHLYRLTLNTAAENKRRDFVVKTLLNLIENGIMPICICRKLGRLFDRVVELNCMIIQAVPSKNYSMLQLPSVSFENIKSDSVDCLAKGKYSFEHFISLSLEGKKSLAEKIFHGVDMDEIAKFEVIHVNINDVDFGTKIRTNATTLCSIWISLQNIKATYAMQHCPYVKEQRTSGWVARLNIYGKNGALFFSSDPMVVSKIRPRSDSRAGTVQTEVMAPDFKIPFISPPISGQHIFSIDMISDSIFGVSASKKYKISVTS